LAGIVDLPLLVAIIQFKPLKNMVHSKEAGKDSAVSVDASHFAKADMTHHDSL
jgi:hypothetical protein